MDVSADVSRLLAAVGAQEACNGQAGQWIASAPDAIDALRVACVAVGNLRIGTNHGKSAHSQCTQDAPVLSAQELDPSCSTATRSPPAHHHCSPAPASGAQRSVPCESPVAANSPGCCEQCAALRDALQAQRRDCDQNEAAVHHAYAALEHMQAELASVRSMGAAAPSNSALSPLLSEPAPDRDEGVMSGGLTLSPPHVHGVGGTGRQPSPPILRECGQESLGDACASPMRSGGADTPLARATSPHKDGPAGQGIAGKLAKFGAAGRGQSRIPTPGRSKPRQLASVG